MAFKMNGSPAKTGGISGTAGHSSALKMRAEENTASAFKQLAGKKMANADWAKGQTKAKSEGGDLDALVKSRGGLKKGTPEYNKVQNKINSALGNKKRYDEGPAAEPTKTQKVVTKGEDKKTKIATKAAKRTSEVTENVTKKTSKISKKDAKKKFGKDSKEFLEAKKANLEAKESDRQGAEGGKKQGLFRKLSSKINAKRQKKNQAKIDAKDSPADMNDKY